MYQKNNHETNKNILLNQQPYLTLPFLFSNKLQKSPASPAIVGTPGNPRFNLQFDNQDNVDLDLHVITPKGKEIYYFNPAGDGGQLDVDCRCQGCALGPNENIYWTPGTAPHGTYKFFVEYYGACKQFGAASNYTLRLMQNDNVLKTYTGVLNREGATSAEYTFNF